MKRFLKIFAVSILVLLVVLAALPFLFKDKIVSKIQSELDNSLNAKAYFDPDAVSVGIFRNFPNLTLTLGNFGVAGIDDFAGDTLAHIPEFKIVLDIMSVISGDQMSIEGIYLERPRFHALVNAAGKANWDIAKTEEEQAETEETEESEPFSIHIQKWKIADAYVVYEDKTLPIYMQIIGLNHEGSGKIGSEIYDLITSTRADTLTVDMDGVKYMNRYAFDAQMVMNIDMAQSKYTFKENTFKINEFAFGFDGYVQMPDTNIDMDITFAAKETEFKNLLSIVPGIYTESFSDIETEGTLAFDGFAKGRFNGESLPGYGVNLMVNNGKFKFPDLSVPVSNVAVDLHVLDEKGTITNMVVDLKKFHADLGSNPIDARMLLQGLEPYNLDADITAKVNLEEMTKIFPMEGLQLKGLFELAANAKGIYDDAAKKMPALKADMKLSNGYVKTVDFPAPLENIQLLASVSDPTGSFTDMEIALSRLDWVLDGEAFESKMKFKNLDDLDYDVDITGVLDFTKISKIFPMDSMTLAGRIKTDLHTKGRMSDVDAGRYLKTSTTGAMDFNKFLYTSYDMPYGFRIDAANLSFNPDKIQVAGFKGGMGSSNFSVNGFLQNYMQYLFAENGTIRGQFDFVSDKMDLNELMGEEDTAAAPVAEEEAPMTAFEVPKNINFTLNSTINQVLYDNYDIRNLTGSIIMNEGVVNMRGLKFDMIGGKFAMNGSYDSRDIQKPKFDYDLDMQNVSAKKAFETFSVIKEMVPIANNFEGNFSTVFKVKGDLKNDMSPVLESLFGAGVVKVADGVVKDVKMLNLITKAANKTGQSNLNYSEVKISNTTVKAEIKNGRVYFEPFDVDAGGNKINIGGSQGIDGTVDYVAITTMPAGAVGEAAAQLFNSLTGAGMSAPQNLLVTLGATGPGTNPNVKILSVKAMDGSGSGQNQLDQAKKQAEEELARHKKEAEEKARQELDKQRLEAEQKARQEQERIKREAEEKAKQELEKQKQDGIKQIKKLF